MALPMTWKKPNSSYTDFALSTFKIQVMYFHGFKSEILHWILKVSFILESKTSTPSKYFLLFKLFSCHPEAATP